MEHNTLESKRTKKDAGFETIEAFHQAFHHRRTVEHEFNCSDAPNHHSTP